MAARRGEQPRPRGRRRRRDRRRARRRHPLRRADPHDHPPGRQRAARGSAASRASSESTWRGYGYSSRATSPGRDSPRSASRRDRREMPERLDVHPEAPTTSRVRPRPASVHFDGRVGRDRGPLDRAGAAQPATRSTALRSSSRRTRRTVVAARHVGDGRRPVGNLMIATNASSEGDTWLPTEPPRRLPPRADSDAVTFEVLRNEPRQPRHEMGLLPRTVGFSPVISRARDFSAGDVRRRRRHDRRRARRPARAHRDAGVHDPRRASTASAATRSTRATSSSSTTPTSAAPTARTCGSSTRSSATASCSPG